MERLGVGMRWEIGNKALLYTREVLIGMDIHFLLRIFKTFDLRYACYMLFV